MLQILMRIFSVCLSISVLLTGCSKVFFPPSVKVSYTECENIRLGSTNVAFLETLNCLSRNNHSLHALKDYVEGLAEVAPESESLIQLILQLQEQGVRSDFHEFIHGVGKSGFIQTLSQFISDLDKYSKNFHNVNITNTLQSILMSPSYWEKADSFFKSDFLYRSIRRMAHTVPNESLDHILNRKWEPLFDQRQSILQPLTTESLIKVLEPMGKDLNGVQRFIHTLGSGEKHETPIFVFSGLVQLASREVQCPKIRRNIPSYLNFLETQFQQRMNDDLAMRRFTMIEIPVFSTFVIQNCNLNPIERQGLESGLQALGQIVKSESHRVLSLFLTGVKQEWGDFSKVGDVFNETSAPFLEFLFSSVAKANTEEDFISALSNHYTHETHEALKGWASLLETEAIEQTIRVIGAYRNQYPVEFANHLENILGALRKALQNEYTTLYSAGRVFSKASDLLNLESPSGLYFIDTVKSEVFRNFFDTLYTLEQSGELNGLLSFILEVNGYNQNLEPRVVRLPRVSLPKEKSSGNWGSGYHQCYQLNRGLFGSVDDFQRVFECFNADNEVPHLSAAINILKDRNQLRWVMNLLKNRLLEGRSFDQFISKLERGLSSGDIVEFAENVLQISTNSKESLLLEDYFKNIENSKQMLWAFLSSLSSPDAPIAFDALREVQTLSATAALAVNEQIFYKTYGLLSEGLVEELMANVSHFVEHERDEFLNLLEFNSEDIFAFLQAFKNTLSRDEIERFVYGVEWAVSDLQKVKYWYGPGIDDYVEKILTPLQRVEILMESTDLELWPWLEFVGLGAKHFGDHAINIFLDSPTPLDALRTLDFKMEWGSIILHLSEQKRHYARNLKENFDVLFELESRGLMRAFHQFLRNNQEKKLNPLKHSQLIKNTFLGLHILYANQRLKTSLRGLLMWVALQSHRNLFAFSESFSDYKKLIDLKAFEMNRLDTLLAAAPFVFASSELIDWVAKEFSVSQDISFLIEDISKLQNLGAKYFYGLSYWFYDLMWDAHSPLKVPLMYSVIDFIEKQDVDLVINFLRNMGPSVIKSSYQVTTLLDASWSYEEVDRVSQVLNILANEGLLRGLILDIQYLIQAGEARRIVEMFIDNFVPMENTY